MIFIIKVNKYFMGNIDRIIRNNIRSFINEEVYYHGTVTQNADGIHRNGLNPSMKQTNVGGGNDEFASGEGLSYLTKNKGNAYRYSLMGNDSDEYSHVFECNSDDIKNQKCDEDEIGSLIYNYYIGKIKELPFNRGLLKLLTPNELNLIKQGNFKGYTACKKILNQMTQNDIRRTLSIVNNMTTPDNVRHRKHYRVKRPSSEEYQEMMNYQKYGNRIMDNLAQYYDKNKEEVY